MSVLTQDGVWSDADHEPDAEAVLWPLAEYLRQSQLQPQPHGVSLSPTDDPIALVPYLQTVPLIAIDFPVFTDGRGYSIASALRNRYRYQGDLRASGDVLNDQLFYLRRVGFSSFALRADQDRGAAIKALRTFSDVYQAAADQSLPAFRRHARPSAREWAGLGNKSVE